VFKKALQIAVTFCLLVGAYLGYTRVFAVVVVQLGQARSRESVPFPETEAKSALRATELARESFGAGFWAARKGVRIRHYDAARGYYLYADNYERLDDGKRLRIWPFAMIWASKDGQSRKTAMSNEAVIDMSQPLGLSKPTGEPSHILHARMTGDVRLRDDKGTRDDPEDDLRVGSPTHPLTHLEYDEKALQISTDSDVFLQDRDLTLNGKGMVIQLRRKTPAPGAAPSTGGAGFDAESALFPRDVHIVVKNVGPTGILPGTARPEKGGQTPLDCRSDGKMLITLPRPRPVVLVGPPDLNRPPDPTLVHFETNVRVLRGTDALDQLNSDTLDLTLTPNPKPADAPTIDVAAVDDKPIGAPTAPGSGGPVTDLKLRKALARGHAVWIQSESQGMKARCTELKYEKATEPGVPDKTYLASEPSRKLWVEKVEYDLKGPDPSAIKSILTLNALDATILDHGPGKTSRVIARGPGKSEERPARNASVARTAWWEDQMELLTWRDGPEATAAPGAGPAAANKGTLRRLITLTGVSKLVEHKDPTTLDARRSIVAEFESGPRATPAIGEGSTRIKWLQGFEDVHLTAPGRTLTARDQLNARFETAPVASVAVAARPTTAGPAQAPAPTGPTSTFVVPAPAVAANLAAPANPAGPQAPPAPPVQAVDARADKVWATIVLGSGDRPNGELKDAQLRGGVMVHQDPAPGEAAGSDASGEALDLTGQGNGLMKFLVSTEQPRAANARTKLASASGARRAPPAVLARVDFKGRTIESEKLIGLDQKLDSAWAVGAGKYLQMADRGLLDDKGLVADGKRVVARPGGPSPGQDRLEITWTDEMRFFGRSRDPQGRDAAKVEFRGASKDVRTAENPREFRRGVVAKMEDAAIYADEMDVYMDRVIALNKEARKPSARLDRDATPETEPQAQIALMDCRGQNRSEAGKLQYAGVDITSQKVDPVSKILLEKYRIQHTHVIYDKRTGDFEAPGAGTTYLYKRENKAGNPAPRPAVVPVAGPGVRARPETGLDPRRVPPLELTKVTYNQGMRGRFGTSKEQAETQARQAEFVGNVQAAKATVAQRNSDIDFDRPNSPDYLFLTSDVLLVISKPPPVDTKAPAHQLLNARGNAQARTPGRTIQADRITFDSATDLTYAYGDDDKEVVMIQQESPGQEPTTLRGKSALYNKTTRQGEIKDPQAIQFYDLKTGYRPKPFYPDTGGTPKPMDPLKTQRVPLQKTQRNATERNGFTGH
jgi:hypothetical protein